MNRLDEHGGPAFPSSVTLEGAVRLQYKGMALRDYFAGRALSALIPLCIRDDREDSSYPDYVAERAYEMADAMLNARGEPR